MKKIISITLLACVLFTLAACGSKNNVPPSTTEPFTFNVVDQSGAPVENAKLMICEGTRVVVTVVTDEKGKASAELYPGEYTVRPESLPEGYVKFESSTKVNLTKDRPSCAVVVHNVKPDGTEIKPFVIDGKTSVELGVGKQAYYLVKPLNKTTLLIKGAADLLAICDGESYRANSEGNIIIDLGGESTVIIRNLGNKVSTTAELVYPFGSDKNPYTAKLDSTYSAELGGRTLHYSYTVKNTETLTLKGLSGEGAYTVTNLTTGNSSSGEGICSLSVAVSVGDKLSFTVTGEGAATYKLCSESADETELPMQPAQ